MRVGGCHDLPACTRHRRQVIKCTAEAQRSTQSVASQQSLTRWAFEQAECWGKADKQAGGAGGGTTYEALQKADAAWFALRNRQSRSQSSSERPFVRQTATPLPQAAMYDVVMCGGTLGVFLACALQLRGLRVAVVERGPLQGRAQEWNISRKELQEVVEAGVLTEQEAEECIGKEFNPVRAGFRGGEDVWTRDILNLGVRPDKLIAKVRQCFEGAGGQPAAAAVPDTQYFWEAFPAGSGPTDRTTYMFSYMDAQPTRPSLEAMMEDYWRLMPHYQGVELDSLQVQRILFGFFPTYRGSPLQPQFDRLLQVGDASGIQSPLSFGGFGAMTRHLARLTNAVEEALQADALDRHSLGAINAYNPGLSSAWMLQRAMSVRPGQAPDPDFINSLLAQNFAAMQSRGDAVLRPFLQDVLQFGPLTATLFGQVVSDPLFIPQIFKHVGVLPLLDWSRHYAALGAYTVLHGAAPAFKALAGKLPPKQRYRLRRQLDAWEFGSGLDYKP
ncbi:hypothetical protein WJX72_000257 [[Myrmecia] bisecta]|uniref:Lycopene beta-cyclase n=1 Tax=[Myrmecia] bisecta TaxID=41462 RepID=A0AAW1P216_9CHLO